MAGAPPAPATRPPLGVLLLYLGGPDRAEAIRPFLRNLFSDRQIIRFPGGPLGQWALARLVSGARARRVAARYAQMGGFPLLPNTLAQATALQAELDRREPGRRHLVRPGFRYWQPWVHEALAEFARAGVEEVVALTLYPQYSRTTTGSSLEDLQVQLGRTGRSWSVRVVERFSDEPAYRALLLQRVAEALEHWPIDERRQVTVLCVAHSVPVSFLEQGDPYQQEVERLRERIREGLGPLLGHDLPVALAYQSRSGPVRWLGPGLEEEARRLIATGARDLLLVPLSFVSDHLETLHELDQCYLPLLREAGARRVERTRSFNDDPQFIALLADLVAAAPHSGLPGLAAAGR